MDRRRAEFFVVKLMDVHVRLLTLGMKMMLEGMRESGWRNQNIWQFMPLLLLPMLWDGDELCMERNDIWNSLP